LKKATAKLNNSLTSNKLLEYDLSDTKSQLQTAHKNNKDLLSENSALQQQNSALQTESKFLQTRIDEFNEFIQPLDTAYSEVTLKYMQMTGMDTNPTSAYIQLNIDVLNKLHKEFPGLAAEEFARRLQFALTEAGFLNATTAE
ncbi:hypothetical protein K0U07_05490, partial [bacterium]|nr:hypothetical protein [bacterium]